MSGEFGDALFGVSELLLDRRRIGIDLGELGTGLGVPSLDVAVDIAAEDALAVLAEGDAEHDIVGGVDRTDRGAVALPQFEGLVAAHRGEVSVRGEFHGLDAAPWAAHFFTCEPLFISQMMTWPSSLEEARTFPSMRQSRSVTARVWPLRV